MAAVEAGVEDLDDDKWLYGDDSELARFTLSFNCYWMSSIVDGNTPEQSDEVVAALLAGDDGVRLEEWWRLW